MHMLLKVDVKIVVYGCVISFHRGGRRK